MQHFTKAVEIAREQRLLHFNRDRLHLIHRRERFRCMLLRALYLTVDDRLGFAAPSETEDEIIFEFVDQELARSQRSDHDLLTIEFHKIEAAEGRRILVLTTAFDSDIVAFDIEGQARHASRGDWQAKQLTEQANQRDGKCRGTSKPGAWRRVGMDEEIETLCTELVEFEPLQHPFNEIHLPVELQVFLVGPVNDRSVIEGAKADRTFRLWHQCTINIARDRGVEHTTAARVGVR